MAVLSVRLRVGALVVGLLSVVAGCAGPEQPTYSCTPETGGAPFPCYKAQWELYQKQDKLYTEAETVYRKFMTENERIHRVGGVTKLTPVLEETTTGEFRQGRLEYYSLDLAKTRTTISGGRFQTVWIKRKPEALATGSLVAMQACFDLHTVTFHEKGLSPWKGGYMLQTYQFVREGNGLKIAAGSGVSPKSC